MTRAVFRDFRIFYSFERELYNGMHINTISTARACQNERQRCYTILLDRIAITHKFKPNYKKVLVFYQFHHGAREEFAHQYHFLLMTHQLQLYVMKLFMVPLSTHHN